MQPRFKFYVKQSSDISWTLLSDEPEGWQDLQDGITRDYAAHGLLVDTKCTLTFTGDGYDYIKNVFDCQSFCAEIQIKIDESCSEGEPYTTCFEGLIKMGDVKFNMNRCYAETPIIDNSYFARIKNNAGIEAYPHVGKSKNGLDITAASMNIVDMFNPTTGAYFGVNRKAYRLFELGKFLVAFMSDGEVGFASDLLDTGDLAGEFLSNGVHLKDGNSVNYQNADIGKLTWDSFIDEIYKFRNVGFTIEYGGVKPVLRLEDADYFFGSTVIDTLANANGVIKKIKTDQLYAYVNFGSDKTLPDEPALSYPDNIDFLGWKDEKLHLTGQCNTENTLDLKGSWVRSSNVIEDLLLGITAATVDTYDEDFILISAEPTGGGNYQAIQYDIFSAGAAPYFYNGNITNDKIAIRFFGAVPNSIASFLGSADDNFKAYREPFTSGNISAGLVPFGTNEPVQFNDDFTAPYNDTNNNYGNGTVQGNQVTQVNSRYTAYRNGLYSFRVTIEEVDCNIAGACLDVFIRRYDSGASLIQYWSIHRCYPVVLPYLNEIFDFNKKYLNATDYVQVDIVFPTGVTPDDTNNGVIFETTLIPGGGIFEEYNNEDFKAIQYTFEYPISNSRWNAIKADPRNKLAFNIDGINDIEPWIEKITYNKKDSMANITLIGKQQTTC